MACGVLSDAIDAAQGSCGLSDVVNPDRILHVRKQLIFPPHAAAASTTNDSPWGSGNVALSAAHSGGDGGNDGYLRLTVPRGGGENDAPPGEFEITDGVSKMRRHTLRADGVASHVDGKTSVGGRLCMDGVCAGENELRRLLEMPAIGSQGPQGELGLTGDKGQRGRTGPRGFTGPTGYTGYRGYRGSKGQKGAEGPRGNRGDTGSIGPAGDPWTDYSGSG